MKNLVILTPFIVMFIGFVAHKQREYIGESAVITIRPKVAAGSGIDQLCIDPHLLADAPHAAFQHMGDIEFAADIGNLEIFAFVGKGRRARSHFQFRNFCEQVEQFLGQAI